MDVAVDWLDGEADHAAEHIGALEDKEADMEHSLNALLELGREQTEASTRAAHGLGQLATCVLAQQNKIRAIEERMDAMREMILGLEHMAANPIVVDVIVTVAYATIARLFFFISLSPTLHLTLVDLIFLLYLIYSRDPYLILPIYLHIRSYTFFIFLPNALVYSMMSQQG